VQRFRIIMGNILFVAPNMFVLRNWIASGLSDLCEESLKLKPVILSHFSELFYTSPKGKRVPNYFFPRSQKRNELPEGFSKCLFLAYYLRLRTYAIEFPNASYQMMTLSKKRDLTHFLCTFIAHIFPKKSYLRTILRSLIDSISPKNNCYKYLEDIKPEFVIVGSPGFQFLDLIVIIEAKRIGIPVHCIVSSWDNMTSRGPMLRRPESLLVWNHHMAKQAVNIHNYCFKNVHVVGSLQFCQYSRKIENYYLHSMFEQLNLSYKSPYFLYLTGQHVPNYEAEDINLLLKMLENSKYSNIPLVVRIHPQANRDTFNRLSHPKLIFDLSPEFSEKDLNGLGFGFEEIIKMGCLLQNSYIVFSSWGTTALLEAAIFNKPIVQLRWMNAFDRQNKNEAKKVIEFQKYPHLIPFDSSNCRLFCDAPESIIMDIETILKDDDRYKINREHAVKDLAMLPLEKTPHRIIEILINYMHYYRCP
jgi:hypothetical protein